MEDVALRPGRTSPSSKSWSISRLSDIGDILGGLEVVYSGVSPSVKAIDEAQDQQISTGIGDLKPFVAECTSRSRTAKRSHPRKPTLGGEAQSRATSIAGQVSQVAARLKVEIVSETLCWLPSRRR